MIHNIQEAIQISFTLEPNKNNLQKIFSAEEKISYMSNEDVLELREQLASNPKIGRASCRERV